MVESECRCVQEFVDSDETDNDLICETPVTCNTADNQVPVDMRNECACAENFVDSDTTDSELICETAVTCDAAENQVEHDTRNECACAENFADSDEADSELICETAVTCDAAENQVEHDTRNECACAENFVDSDTTDNELICEEMVTCDAAENQFPHVTRNECACADGFVDSDETDSDLICETPVTCNTADNQVSVDMRNECDCANMFEDLDDTTPLECVPVCVPPAVRQPDNSCAEPMTTTMTMTVTLADCEDNEKLSSGECEDLTSADCLPAEKFENGMCVLLEPEDGAALTPPYGDYTAATCTGANWPWSIVQTADGLSELCHAPVNLLATEVPSSQALNDAGGQLDFCVLRGAESGDSVRCDDPTVFGSLGIPRAPEGLVAQITTVITITLSDESTREASVVTASVANYLEIVHVSGSVVAVLPPDTTAAEITTARPLVGTISLEVSVSMAPPTTNTMTPPPATNTMTPPPATNTVAPPAAGGGGGGAAALIAVPIVLIGGYWLLGGFDYIDPEYGFSYSGENESFHYTGNAGFNLRHGGLRSYASAIQSYGDAVSYESGISYEKEYLSLTYDAAESESEYLYDLGARMQAEFGLWTIAPAAGAEFQYQREKGEWRSESSAGLRAAWTAHRWKVEARSDFTGVAHHGLDLELRF